MAALVPVINSRRDYVTGNIRIVQADLANVANGDTWRPGFSRIESAEFQPVTQAGGAAPEWSLTWTGQVITFTVSSGTLKGTLKVWGV